MKNPIDLYLEAGNDPLVRAARHDMNNKACAVELCKELLSRAQTDEQRERLTIRFIKALGEMTKYFGIYVDIKSMVYWDLMAQEGYLPQPQKEMRKDERVSDEKEFKPNLHLVG